MSFALATTIYLSGIAIALLYAAIKSENEFLKSGLFAGSLAVVWYGTTTLGTIANETGSVALRDVFYSFNYPLGVVFGLFTIYFFWQLATFVKEQFQLKAHSRRA